MQVNLGIISVVGRIGSGGITLRLNKWKTGEIFMYNSDENLSTP